jgi:hypothetical protein
MILDRQISTEGHIVHLGVALTPSGWNVFEKLDSTTVHVEHHEGWHRVERALDRLELEVLQHGIGAFARYH